VLVKMVVINFNTGEIVHKESQNDSEKKNI